MKKTYLLLTALIIFVSFSNAQKDDINGIRKISINNQATNQNSSDDFNPSNPF